MKTLLITVATAVLFTSCKKENPVGVEYRASCEDCFLTYASDDGDVTVRFRESYSAKVTLQEGDRIAASCCRAVSTVLQDQNGQPILDTIGGAITIWAFVNGEAVSTRQSGTFFPDSCTSFQSTAPEL